MGDRYGFCPPRKGEAALRPRTLTREGGAYAAAAGHPRRGRIGGSHGLRRTPWDHGSDRPELQNGSVERGGARSAVGPAPAAQPEQGPQFALAEPGGWSLARGVPLERGVARLRPCGSLRGKKLSPPLISALRCIPPAAP